MGSKGHTQWGTLLGDLGSCRTPLLGEGRDSGSQEEREAWKRSPKCLQASGILRSLSEENTGHLPFSPPEVTLEVCKAPGGSPPPKSCLQGIEKAKTRSGKAESPSSIRAARVPLETLQPGMHPCPPGPQWLRQPGHAPQTPWTKGNCPPFVR